MVMEGIQEDMGDGSMQCVNHPYKNSSPGGVCALCLQEKLGKLVSSSFPSAIFPSSSSSSTPSVRSEIGGVTASSQPVQMANKVGECSNGDHHQFEAARKPRTPFQRRKKKGNNGEASGTVFKRSKSANTPRNRMGFLENDENDGDDNISPRKRGFWSFLYYSASKKIEKPGGGVKDSTFPSSSASGNGSNVVRDKKRESFAVVEEENERSDNQGAHERKVSRSRSVGCGSRSFSGDLFERISTGFGDCTLRRVESQREGKPKPPSVQHRNSGASGQDCIRERVKCGGIFSGFMIIASSSSSSSDWVSSEENGKPTNPTIPPASVEHHHHHLAHGRTKNWGWALASPMRAFTKPSSTGKTEASNKNTTPNLAAIPSLLTVRS
nr:uncharacterized protein LOC109176080 [Ipomoea batatas]GMD80612.1 uncharacterized protein LOC109176080 [Ipomoea batatas]